MKIKLKYGEYDCILERLQYQNGRTALQLYDAVDGTPVLTATVNIPEAPLNSDQVLIKNWSENEGILDALIEHKVVVDTGVTVPTGFVEANLCVLLPQSERGV